MLIRRGTPHGGYSGTVVHALLQIDSHKVQATPTLHIPTAAHIIPTPPAQPPLQKGFWFSGACGSIGPCALKVIFAHISAAARCVEIIKAPGGCGIKNKIGGVVLLFL